MITVMQANELLRDTLRLCLDREDIADDELGAEIERVLDLTEGELIQ